MRVRALTSFVSELGKHESGDEFEMDDAVAVIRIKAGLIRSLGKQPETATLPEPETAVARPTRSVGKASAKKGRK